MATASSWAPFKVHEAGKGGSGHHGQHHEKSTKGVTDKLAKTWRTHKTPILLGGAGLAAGLGYLQYRTGAEPVADPGTAPMGADVAGYAPQGATGMGGGAYDSTGNDVYNALQPQIEQTQSMLDQLLNRRPGGKKVVHKVRRRRLLGIRRHTRARVHRRERARAKQHPNKKHHQHPAAHHGGHQVHRLGPHKTGHRSTMPRRRL